MMPLWRTFFRLVTVVAGASVCFAASTVTGVVQVTAGAERGHAHGDDLSDIVVWLQPTSKAALQPVQALRATLLQKNKMFHPHVLPIRVGTLVDFPNADPIFHSAFSNYDGQLFDLVLYPPGTTRSVRFRRPGIVRVFCNIHPSMSAVIVVLDTPYFTKADFNGTYRFLDVSPGEYELHLFDEKATSGLNSANIVTVSPEDTQVTASVIRMSESGYVRPPHKNKYGQEYAPGADSEGYSGAPK